MGALDLPEQAFGGVNWSNDVQIGDTWVINSHLLMEPRFLWRRISNNSIANSPTDSICHGSGHVHHRGQWHRCAP